MELRTTQHGDRPILRQALDGSLQTLIQIHIARILFDIIDQQLNQVCEARITPFADLPADIFQVSAKLPPPGQNYRRVGELEKRLLFVLGVRLDRLGIRFAQPG